MRKASAGKVAPRMSDPAVRAKTGKAWGEWFAILDKAGARKTTHQEIAAILRGRYGLGPWWQQMVAVTYEQARGLRAKHQKSEGFQISRSATLAAPISKMFAAWKDDKIRARWLKESGLAIRKATPNKNIRMTWKDGRTSVEVGFDARGNGKTQVIVQHSKLPNSRAAERTKAYWGNKLEQLRTAFGS